MTTTADYTQKIPDNVICERNRRLRRALESWQPNFLNWWQTMRPTLPTRDAWYARPTARRCSASRRRTGACRRRRPSSPTAWGTRCCSRCRPVPRPCSNRRRRGPRSSPAGPAKYGATLFFAGPTFFASMLRADLPADALAGVRLAASAGEALPAAPYTRWTTHFGVDILDGLGMTEMLHIFLSSRVGQVRLGSTGMAVPGYDLKIVDDDGLEVPVGTPGTLLVRGASAATGYWSRYHASRLVFQGIAWRLIPRSRRARIARWHAGWPGRAGASPPSGSPRRRSATRHACAGPGRRSAAARTP